MIEITKSEAQVVRKHFPDACIAKTRHKRYLEESERYLSLIPENLAANNMLKKIVVNRERAAKYRQATNQEAV